MKQPRQRDGQLLGSRRVQTGGRADFGPNSGRLGAISVRLLPDYDPTFDRLRVNFGETRG